MPLYTVRNSVAGERDRLGRSGWRPHQPLPPPITHPSPRCFHPQPDHPVRSSDSDPMPHVLPVLGEHSVRICTTLHHFAVILRPSHNWSPPKTSASWYQQLGLMPGPKLCRSLFPFRSSFGLVSTPRLALPRRISKEFKVIQGISRHFKAKCASLPGRRYAHRAHFLRRILSRTRSCSAHCAAAGLQKSILGNRK
jgi:hypothetical protein